jgi:hypothetical protein
MEPPCHSKEASAGFPRGDPVVTGAGGKSPEQAGGAGDRAKNHPHPRAMRPRGGRMEAGVGVPSEAKVIPFPVTRETDTPLSRAYTFDRDG